MAKRCTRCKLTRGLDAFSRDGSRGDGFQARCRECQRQVAAARQKAGEAKALRDRYRNTPDGRAKTRAGNRLAKLKRYGLTPEAKQLMAQAQNDKCAGCEKLFSKTTACVDHDHNSGRVRGLLCRQCNQVLGLVYDQPTVLDTLAAYLRKHRITAHWQVYLEALRTADNASKWVEWRG